MLDTVDAALARVVAEPAEVKLPENATPLDFLCAVYRDPVQPIGRRLNAAIAAAPFMHAKLTANANIDKESFAKLMEDCVRRSGRSNVIDSKTDLHNGPNAPRQIDSKANMAIGPSEGKADD